MRGWILFVMLAACLPGIGDQPGDPLGPEVEVIRLEVDYESDAAPYTGNILLVGDTWDVFHTNLEALLAPSQAVLDAPRTLAEMDAFPAQGKASYTVAELLGLSADTLDDPGDETTATFHALWVDGYFEQGGEVRTGVLGVSIGATRVVAMFKPVIANLGPTQAGRNLGEQAVLVHELGHALGLVDNGVAPVADHHDEEHGAHCANDGCVMYWALENSGALNDFVAQQITDSDSVLFDQDCRDDVSAAIAARRGE